MSRMICLKERGRASGYALPGRAWKGNEGRGKRMEKSEAEPREMRYQAEPVNEESSTKSRI